MSPESTVVLKSKVEHEHSEMVPVPPVVRARMIGSSTSGCTPAEYFNKSYTHQKGGLYAWRVRDFWSRSR